MLLIHGVGTSSSASAGPMPKLLRLSSPSSSGRTGFGLSASRLMVQGFAFRPMANHRLCRPGGLDPRAYSTGSCCSITERSATRDNLPSHHGCPMETLTRSPFGWLLEGEAEFRRGPSRTTHRSILSMVSSDEVVSSGDCETNDTASPSRQSQQPLGRLDRALSFLTSLFPLFVLSAAIGAALHPPLLTWVNRGDTITVMLASVMVGMGMTLERRDFEAVLRDKLDAVPTGVLCQFVIMPLTALFVGRGVLMKSVGGGGRALLSKSTASALYLGLALVGCSPGGTASNLVSLIAGADVALSVLLTACSTVLASVATPLLVKALVGTTVSVSGWALCAATAKVVLLPVAGGMAANGRFPRLCRRVSRFTPLASVVLVALICGGVVAQNASSVGTSSLSSSGLRLLLGCVVGMHSIGFAAGYVVPRRVMGFSPRTSRTISIETGMQNSALAVVLARSIGADPLASLPGALSATVHSCLGSVLAAYWRFRDSSSGDAVDV